MRELRAEKHIAEQHIEGHCQEGVGQSYHCTLSTQRKEEAGNNHDTEVKGREGAERHEAHQRQDHAGGCGRSGCGVKVHTLHLLAGK